VPRTRSDSARVNRFGFNRPRVRNMAMFEKKGAGAARREETGASAAAKKTRL
jgi:hypothetical protein